MATKLRKMHLTSVDLVRAGANQEADICLFKSADGQNSGQQAAQSEEELFKQFLDWKQNQPTEGTSAASVEKSEAELYVDAISKSVQSICEDEGLSAGEKLDALSKSCSEFNAAVEKYNHNHDSSTGQFTSGSGRASAGRSGSTSGSGGNAPQKGATYEDSVTHTRFKVLGVKGDNVTIKNQNGIVSHVKSDFIQSRSKLISKGFAFSDIDEIEEI